MDYIKLVDGTHVTIEDGASLDHIVHIAENETAAVAVCEKIINPNVRRVEFWQDDPDIDTPYGGYDNVVVAYPPIRQTNPDDTVTVVISLREMTPLEVRVSELESENEALSNELTDTQMALTEIYEMVFLE